MATDNVPWIVGGGVNHSTDVARLVTYAAFNGEEGIIGPTDLEVRELATPGSQVRVLKGAGAAINRVSGVEYEAYAFRNVSDTNIDIPANTATSGTQSYLVIARIKNPWEDTSLPAVPTGSEQTYDYFSLETLACANGSTGGEIATNGYSAIPLARVDVPANTVTITQSMIVDLRKLTQVRHAETFNLVAPTAERRANSTTWANWPPDANFNVDVPEWATHVQLEAILAGIQFGASGNNAGAGWNTYGNLRIKMGTDANAVYSQATAYNESVDTGIDRTTLMAGSPAVAIPKAYRGTTQSFQIEAQEGGGTTWLWVNNQSMVSLHVKFQQAPESTAA